MNTAKRTVRLALLLTAGISLAGCLSESGDDTEQVGVNTPPPDPGNSAPSISGNPSRSTRIGDPYSFTPVANDPDGDPLTFSIENTPSWASFDPDTGELAGTPSLGDVGVYTNIRISVGDGNVTVSLASFSIEVNQDGTATGSVTISWSAPTENEDGSALTDLSGYRIYYGIQSRNYNNQIDIDNPGITTYVVEDLPQDTYYFAATAIDSQGEESRLSAEAIKVVN